MADGKELASAMFASEDAEASASTGEDRTAPASDGSADKAESQDKAGNDAGQGATQAASTQASEDQDESRQDRKVPLTDLVKTRQKAAEYRKERDELRKKLASDGSGDGDGESARIELPDDVEQLTETERSRLQELEGRDDDDYMSVAEAKQLTQLQRKRDQVEAAMQSRREAVEQVESSIDAAMESTDGVEDGLDFSTVYDEGYDNLSKRDHEKIMEAGENAADVMYELILARTPELRDRQRAQGRSPRKQGGESATTRERSETSQQSRDGAPTPGNNRADAGGSAEDVNEPAPPLEEIVSADAKQLTRALMGSPRQ